MHPILCRSIVFGLVLAWPSLNQLICLSVVCSFVVGSGDKIWQNNYFAGKGITRPGFQAGACWVERKGYIRGSVARGSHLGL